MRLVSVRFLAAFLFLSCAAVISQATTYYVATTGADTNSCKTSALSCKTITHAASLATSPGDIVQVAAGTYSESLNFTKSGTSAGPITFRGQTGSGCPTTAISDVNNPTGTRPASPVVLTGSVTLAASYVVLDCFHLKGGGGLSVNSGVASDSITNDEIEGTGTSGGGIYFNGVGSVKAAQYASNFTISGNYIHAVSNGIFLVCNSCTVTNNEITALTGDEPGSDHDYVDAWGIGSTFRHNYMHANSCNSCQGYDCHMDCIQTWNTTGDGTEVSQNMTFDRNVCFNHHEGVIVQDNAGNGDVSNWTVTNNIFAYGPYDDGSGHLCQAGTVHPWCWIFQDGKLGTNYMENNTCKDGAMGANEASSGTFVWKNNSWFSTGSDATPYERDSSVNITGANNNYYSASGGNIEPTFSGDLNVNPQVISIGSGDAAEQCIGCNFNIQASSGLINAGVTTSPQVTTDLLGTPRPQGPAFDIGAYEFLPTTKPGAPTDLRLVLH